MPTGTGSVEFTFDLGGENEEALMVVGTESAVPGSVQDELLAHDHITFVQAINTA